MRFVTHEYINRAGLRVLLMMKVSKLRLRTTAKNLPDRLRERLRTGCMLRVDARSEKIGNQIYRQYRLAGPRTSFDDDDSLSLILEPSSDCVSNLLVYDHLFVQQHPRRMLTNRAAQVLHQLSTLARFSALYRLEHFCSGTRR